MAKIPPTSSSPSPPSSADSDVSLRSKRIRSSRLYIDIPSGKVGEISLSISLSVVEARDHLSEMFSAGNLSVWIFEFDGIREVEFGGLV